jgi:hypothetical protein
VLSLFESYIRGIDNIRKTIKGGENCHIKGETEVADHTDHTNTKVVNTTEAQIGETEVADHIDHTNTKVVNTTEAQIGELVEAKDKPIILSTNLILIWKK